MDKMQIMKTSTREKQCMPGCGFPFAAGLSRLCRNVSLAAGSCLLSALLLLAGCSEEQAAEPCGGSDGDRVAVNFEVEGLSQIATKAALTANTTVRVIVYKYKSNTGPTKADYVADQAYYWDGSKLVPCTVDADGNRTADAPDQAMILLSGQYDFYAVSPALPLVNNNTNVLVPNGVDYATTTNKKTQEIPSQLTPYTITLNQLDRQCAQVRLILEKDNGFLNSAASQTVNVNSVKVSGLSPNMGVIVGKSITASSSGAQVLTLAQEDFSASGSTYAADFCLLPLQNAKLTFEVDMEVNGVNMTRTGELTAVTLERSKLYTITARIIASASDIRLLVDSWSKNNDTYSFGSYPYVDNGTIIVMQDRCGSASGYTFHGAWSVTPTHAESEATNNDSGLNTVSSRFEVSYDGTYRMTWGDAVTNKCKDGWRLPTVRELGVIRDMRGSLRVDYAFNDNYFWTATEDEDNTYVWAQQVDGSGSRGVYSKDRLFAVCCVRDL